MPDTEYVSETVSVGDCVELWETDFVMLKVALDDGEEMGDCDEVTQLDAAAVVDTVEVIVGEPECIPVNDTDDEIEFDIVLVRDANGELDPMSEGDTLPVIEGLPDAAAVEDNEGKIDALPETEGVVDIDDVVENDIMDRVTDTDDVVEGDTEGAPVIEADEEIEFDVAADGDVDTEFDIQLVSVTLVEKDGLQDDVVVADEEAAPVPVNVAVPVPLPEPVPDEVEELEAVEL